MLNAIELAKKYIELSNQGNLNSIAQMFHPNARYVSTKVGEHNGVDNILGMMTSFFDSFGSPQWQVATYHLLGDSCVQFDFVMTGINRETNEQVRRTGLETISFDQAGMIAKIEVKAE